MTAYVKASGTWREVKKVYTKVSGTWREVKQAWTYAAGGWKAVFKNEIRYINTANRTGANIYELMGSPTSATTFIFENQAPIIAGTGSFALRTGVFPAGSTLIIINKNYIWGKGGAGGHSLTTANPTAGAAGGTGLLVDYPCTIDNGAGYIFGGGGGGGGSINVVGARTYYFGGGGGAGQNAGAGGTASGPYSVSGMGGTASSGGAGGSYGSAYGGAGGGLGAAGGRGNGSTTPAGGAGGKAIAKQGKAVTISAGDNTTQIRGAVS